MQTKNLKRMVLTSMLAIGMAIFSPTAMIAQFSTGGSSYADLPAAVAAVANGGTVTMTQNVIVSSQYMVLSAKTYTVDFGGYTLSTSTTSSAVIYLGGGATVTLKNGSIINSYSIGTGGEGLRIDGMGNSTNVTLDAITISATRLAIWNDEATLYILSGDYTGGSYAGIYTAGSRNKTGITVITSGNFHTTSTTNGCIYNGGYSQTSFADNSAPDVSNWLNSAKDVTIKNMCEKISLTWEAGTEFNCFNLAATNYDTFTINWGDGKTDEHAGKGSGISEQYVHEYADAGTYNVTITANSTLCQFTNFNCVSMQLTSLDVSGCTALTLLRCYNNELESLDVSGCTALEQLSCANNLIANLDLSSCTALKDLICYNNNLSSLDLSACTALENLDCANNHLSSLDISGLTKLIILDCANNHLPLSELYAISEILGNNHALYRNFDVQFLPARIVETGVALFSDQSIFDGIYTQYTVVMGNSSGYTVTDGTITFNTKGFYVIEMSNDALISPASVFIELTVEENEGEPTGCKNLPVANNVLRLYPNPVKDVLMLDASTDGEYTVLNVSGQVLMHGNLSSESTVINVKSLPVGTYFIKAGNGTGKFVKE